MMIALQKPCARQRSWSKTSRRSDLLSNIPEAWSDRTRRSRAIVGTFIPAIAIELRWGPCDSKHNGNPMEKRICRVLR